jgi:hypothetical protein
MIDLCHTKRDRKRLQQIIQIFIFNVDRLSKDVYLIYVLGLRKL